MSQAPLIRVATAADMHEVWRLCVDFHREFQHRFGDLAPEKAYRKVEATVRAHPSLVAQGDRINGLLLMELFQSWHGHDWFLGDLVFYVAPEARGRGAADGLLERARAIAKDMGVRLMIRVSSGLAGPHVDRFYRRHGLSLIGSAYVTEG